MENITPTIFVTPFAEPPDSLLFVDGKAGLGREPDPEPEVEGIRPTPAPMIFPVVLLLLLRPRSAKALLAVDDVDARDFCDCKVMDVVRRRWIEALVHAMQRVGFIVATVATTQAAHAVR